jgi:ABC-type nitrate/sulfonate/bicarbonate transport system ATPase subunit
MPVINGPSEIASGVADFTVSTASNAIPHMLIMDEPFSGLDVLTHMKMREEVVGMHE